MNYFVTGTDTGVGKTLVACALLHGFAARGKLAAGMKPVAAGVDADGRNEDVRMLLAASNVAADDGLVNPYCFAQAIAPHIAARTTGGYIEFERIAEAYRKLAALAEVVVVEGAGGLLVPLNQRQDGADLVAELELAVVMVVGMRLGCLNHALLTVEAIESRGLRLAGWVANILDGDMRALQDNIEALRERISVPLLGVVPYLAPADARVASGYLRLERLRS